MRIKGFMCTRPRDSFPVYNCVAKGSRDYYWKIEGLGKPLYDLFGGFFSEGREIDTTRVIESALCEEYWIFFSITVISHDWRI